MKLDNNNQFPHIDYWEPEEGDIKAIPDGKTMVIMFNEIFPNTKCIKALNTFNVVRDSYASRLTTFQSKDGTQDMGICHYINYFIKYYDDDNELLMAYFKLKCLLDRKGELMGVRKFNNLLQRVLYTPTLIEKLHKLTEANYIVDLSQDPNDKKEYPKSLQFTNDHAKILMSISFMMKIASPVIYHYIGRRREKDVKKMIKEERFDKIDASDDIKIFLFYEPLFILMCPPHINIWNKLYITALSKYNANMSHNKPMWNKIEIFGIGRDNALEDLIKEKLVSDNIFKYTYVKSVVNFNSVILEKQLGYYNKEDYRCDLKEISNDKGTGNLSSKDKFDMASNKIDEFSKVLSKENIMKTIEKIAKKFDVKVNGKEVEFYKNKLDFGRDSVQKDLVDYVFAKDFKGFSDLTTMSKRNYTMLFILLKKYLINNGYEYLPNILTGIKISKLNSYNIVNTKFINDVKESNSWNKLMSEKFSMLKALNKEDLLINLLERVINTTFVHCDYENPQLNEEVIDYDKYALARELLNLMWFI